MKIKYLFIIALIAILVPGLFSLLNGNFFGDDPYQYVLGARALFTGFKTIYSYPYPLISIIYFPTLFLSNNLIIWYSTMLSMVLFYLTFISFYCMVKQFGIGEIHSFLGALVFAFSPLIIMEIGWGGQAQYLSFIFSFLSIGFIKKKVLPFVFIFLSIISEPFTSVMGLIFIFLSLLYERRIKDLVYFFISAGSGAGIIYLIVHRKQMLYTPPLITQVSFFNIFNISVLNLSILITVAFIIIITVLTTLIIYKNNLKNEKKWYFLIIIFFFIGTVSYLFITPFTLSERIAYFIMVPIGVLVSMSLHIEKIKWKKILIIVISIILISVSYQAYLGDINYYKAPSYLAEVGDFINLHSGKNDTFLNVNIKNGWALEAFSSREMFYGASEMQYVIYKDQAENVLLGKIMSYSEYYYNSSQLYLFLNSGTLPLSLYSLSNSKFMNIFSLDIKNSTWDGIPLYRLPHNSSSNVLNFGVLYLQFFTDNNLSIKINSEENSSIKFVFNNSEISLTGTNITVKTINGITFEIYSKNFALRHQSLYLNFTGTQWINITGGKFYFHSTDNIFKNYRVKFVAFYYDEKYLSRFISDGNFTFAVKINNVYLFSFRYS
ncbi:MAG: hypothetical protein ACPLVI_07050 [Thermoplasmata archaeon]|jgi:hypothetical protein